MLPIITYHLFHNSIPFYSKESKHQDRIMRLLAVATTTAPHSLLIRHTSPPVSSREPQLSDTATPTCSPQTCRWRPYGDSNDFETNAMMILVVLFCALICALALNVAMRCFLRRGRAGSQQERKPGVGLAAAPVLVALTVVYTAGMELAGAEAECAICLSEFVEGEGVQVLGSCKHGFHVQCIQQWLCSHSSCPTCRSNCLLSTSSSQENSQTQQNP